MPQKDPEKRKEYHRQYYQQNKAAILLQDKIDYAENKNQKRSKHYLKSYGITEEDYQCLLKQQNNLCRICNKPESVKTRLCVDHCHTTGNVRGLLCTHCNTALGHFFDDVSLLQKAILYLNE